MQHIVKRQGHKEKFDERKVYATCYAAGKAAQLSDKDNESMCSLVCKEIKKWIKNKKEVTSEEIHKQMVKVLQKHHAPTAMMFETHRDIA